MQSSPRLPLVSIGMPAYNCERTVVASVRSILKQSFQDWELLVMDDGSTDRTLEMVHSFQDSRIKMHADGKHLGLVPRLNQAVVMSDGKYFARMDADDVAYPERLERQMDYLRRHPAIDVVACGLVVFGEGGLALGTRRFEQCHDGICSRPWAGFPMPHPTWMGRTEWFRTHPYDARAVRAEDQVLLLRSYRNSRFACLPEILQGYQESRLVLRSILRGRFSFTNAVFREYCSRGAYFTALCGTMEQSAKAVLDILAITTGLNYRILRHRALPTAEDAVRRWSDVWLEVKEA